MNRLHRPDTRILLSLFTVLLLTTQNVPALELRVMTYNIHHAEGTDGKLDLDRIVEVIKSAEPDVVCLQEVDQYLSRTDRMDMPDLLMKKLGMTMVFGPNYDFDDGHYGNVTLSKYPIDSFENIALPNPYNREPRGCLKVVIEIPGTNGTTDPQKITIFNTHLGLIPEERYQQAVHIVTHINPDDITVLAGDLNEQHDADGMKVFFAHLNDADKATPQLDTIPSVNPSRRIDYVLQNGFTVKSILYPESHQIRIASDHRPLVASLSLDTKPTLSLQPPKNGNTYVIAHRGAHIGIPENTLAAYEKAIDLGADFVEVDIRTTKDGKLVSIHDSTVDAYTKDTSGKVGDFTLTELKALDIGTRVDLKWAKERIPTFDEILELCKGRIGIYLDLKDGDIAEVAGVIQKFDMQHNVVWCISPREIAPMREACPTCVDMPDPGDERNLPRLFERYAPRMVSPVWRDFSSTYSKKAHDAGAIVFVDESESNIKIWKQALEWGADGIQTDDPEALIRYIKSLED